MRLAQYIRAPALTVMAMRIDRLAALAEMTAAAGAARGDFFTFGRYTGGAL